jgi:hypothetical protein
VCLPAHSYFAVGNEQELSARLRQTIKEGAPQRVRYEGLEEYQWEHIAARTMGVYKSL